MNQLFQQLENNIQTTDLTLLETVWLYLYFIHLVKLLSVFRNFSQVGEAKLHKDTQVKVRILLQGHFPPKK